MFAFPSIARISGCFQPALERALTNEVIKAVAENVSLGVTWIRDNPRKALICAAVLVLVPTAAYLAVKYGPTLWAGLCKAFPGTSAPVHPDYVPTSHELLMLGHKQIKVDKEHSAMLSMLDDVRAKFTLPSSTQECGMAPCTWTDMRTYLMREHKYVIDAAAQDVYKNQSHGFEKAHSLAEAIRYILRTGFEAPTLSYTAPGTMVKTFSGLFY